MNERLTEVLEIVAEALGCCEEIRASLATMRCRIREIEDENIELTQKLCKARAIIELITEEMVNR